MACNPHAGQPPRSSGTASPPPTPSGDESTFDPAVFCPSPPKAHGRPRPDIPSPHPTLPTTQQPGSAPCRLRFPRPRQTRRDPKPPPTHPPLPGCQCLLPAVSRPFTSAPGPSSLETYAEELNTFLPSLLSPARYLILLGRPRRPTYRSRHLHGGPVHSRPRRLPRCLHRPPHSPSFLGLALPVHPVRVPPAWPHRYATVQPYVDAAQCLLGCPPPTHAGLVNHQCKNPTCSPA